MGPSISFPRSESAQTLLRINDHIASSHHNKFSIHSAENISQYFSHNGTCEHGQVPIFLHSVTMMDCHFNEIFQGSLELRESELIFRHGSSFLKWPLHCIRWYGRGWNVIVFESGRRCQSGPGLFVFKCKKARKFLSVLRNQLKHLMETSLALGMACAPEPVTQKLSFLFFPDSMPCHTPPDADQLTTTTSLSDYPDMTSASDRTQALDARGGLTHEDSDSAASGQYVIAVASHSYENQLGNHALLRSEIPVTGGIPFEERLNRVENDYVSELH